MSKRTSDAYAAETRRSERRVRTGPFVTVVQGGWVGQTQSQTSKVASYRSTPTTTYEDVEHYRDNYAVYGDDPSLPDAIRSLETTRVHTGRDTWTERQEHTTYEREFDGYRDVTTTWRDISWDGGGWTRSRWSVASPGHRVYHVRISLFGHVLHTRLYDAVHLAWEYPPDFGWRLFRRKALELIAIDVAAWRRRARRLQPGGFRAKVRDLVCFDANVVAVDDRSFTVQDAAGTYSIGAKPGLEVRVDDFLLIAKSPNLATTAVVHNVTTGGTWRALSRSPRPDAKTIVREHALTISAGLVGVSALGIGLHDNALQYLTAPVVVAALATGYLLGRRARARLDMLESRARTARIGIDDTVSYLKTMSWKGLRGLPPARPRR